jgi:hypothetical protein
MNGIYRIAGPLVMMAATVAAQDSVDPVLLKQRLRQIVSGATVMGVQGAVMGPAVKGVPYSATELAENSQTLTDGTNIDRKTQTNVYRDSEGRMRRETADQVTIWDPVAGVSYLLDTKTQTAHKMMVASYVASGAGLHVMAGGGDVTYVAHGGFAAGASTLPDVLPPPPPFLSSEVKLGPKMVMVARDGQKPAGKTESLGNQTINGVNATGTRATSTIDTGVIGNDRPIQIVSESWYSPELQTMVKSNHSDPRMGQETFELTNISRTEPSPDLFQVPVGYEIVGPK